MTASLAIVLAAGKGTRMKSDRPKVLAEVWGRPLIDYVLDVLDKVGVERVIVVVGYRADLVQEALRDRKNITFVEQTEQLGTGHAVMVCRDELEGYDGPVLVLTGDSPMVQSSSLATLLQGLGEEGESSGCVLGTLNKGDPTGLGRIVRDDAGEFTAIVEEKDATDEQRLLTEVNMSTYAFRCADLLFALDRLTDENKQKEYYITDCPGILRAEGRAVKALPVLLPCEALSINTVDELALVEAEMKRMGYACKKP